MKTEYSITMLRKRLFAMLIAVTFIFLAVFSRLFYIQVIWGEFLQAKALDQWTRDLPVVASRGLIFDRNGILLAGNDEVYAVYLRSRSVKDEENTARKISEILQLDYNAVLKKVKNKNVSEITLKRQVSKDILNQILEADLDGIYYSKDNKRIYPYGDFMSQLLGFTTVDSIGITGIEGYYNNYLKGSDGQVLYEADLLGIEIEESTPKFMPAINGLNLSLTIDKNIQFIAEAAMENAIQKHGSKSAAAIVMNPQTGEILAVASKPSVDMNALPRDNITLLNSLTRNSIISDVYEPGSTFKIFTSAANIEEYLKGNKNAFSNEHIFSSARTRTVDGQVIKCWNNHASGKHSNENLAMALNNSCNPIFVDMAMSLGKQTMYHYLNAFNFGEKTGVDFFGEANGLVLPESAVKNCDLARISFGQTVAVSGLQLAAATAAAVNGGTYYKPYLVKEIRDNKGNVAQIINPQPVRQAISKQASQILASMLEGVVRDGSGKNAYIDGYRVGGKTGTAQKYENGRIAQGKNISSFIGFFPADNPQYLTLVIVDEPEGVTYGSVVAAPFAKMIFEGIIYQYNIKPSV